MPRPMLQKLHIATAVAIAGIAPGYLLAADAPAAKGPAAPGFADVLTSSGIAVSGYVAGSYYHSSGYNTFHQFDIQHDTFQLDQAGLQIAYQPKEGFGALVDLMAGEDARILNSAEQGSTFLSGNTFDVRQAFVQYAGGPLTVIAGKYVTLAGAEVIAPTGNTNFSRSFLFFAEPLTHTGVRATYALSDTVSLIGGVNNGWNRTSINTGSKTGEVGIGFTPSKQFSLTAQAYFGKDPGVDAPRTIFDTVATFNASDALSFVASFDWGKQEFKGAADEKWWGVAGYVNYAMNDQWRVSVRAEYFNDQEGFMTATPQKLKEATVTFGYSPIKNFELRIEGRYDKSDQKTFIKTETAGGTPTSFDDTQSEIALQGVYKFSTT